MLTLDEFHFQHSVSPDPSFELPPLFFNTLPFRLSTRNDRAMREAQEKATAEWTSAISQNSGNPAQRNLTGLMKAVYPEISEHLFAPLTRLSTMVGFWDDNVETLDTQMQESVVADLLQGIFSESTPNQPARFTLDCNRLIHSALIDFLTELGGNDVQDRGRRLFASIAKAQITPKLQHENFEAYRKHRPDSAAVEMVTGLLHHIYNLPVTQEELDSVSPMVQLCHFIAAFSNDVYSFHKEFEEHTQAGNLDAIHNGVALLMSNYGYTEPEAAEIIKREVLDAEKRLMDAYEAWRGESAGESLSSSVPKSDALRQYMVLLLVAIGSANYAQSRARRYQRTDLTTTSEDRASLVGRNYDGVRRLEGYPPPGEVLST